MNQNNTASKEPLRERNNKYTLKYQRLKGSTKKTVQVNQNMSVTVMKVNILNDLV